MDFSQLEATRNLRTKDMDASSLGLYENLRRVKQGRGVARIERGTCQGCRLSLPTHLVQRVRTGGLLVQCPSCERILVTRGIGVPNAAAGVLNPPCSFRAREMGLKDMGAAAKAIGSYQADGAFVMREWAKANGDTLGQPLPVKSGVKQGK